MNFDQLRKSIGQHVRIRPIARRPSHPEELPRLDDDWVIEKAVKQGIVLRNLRTAHAPILGWDHIYSYTSDPARDRNGVRYGFLRLRVQLYLHVDRCDVEPLEPGKWDSETSQLAHPPANRPLSPLPRESLRIVAGDSKGSFLTDSPGFSKPLFFLEHLHPDRRTGSGDSAFDLSFSLPRLSRDELKRTLELIGQSFSLEPNGSFIIEQSECSWYGFGIQTFLKELADRGRRYQQRPGLRWHHSEDFSFVAPLANGMALISGRKPAEDRLMDSDYNSVEITLTFPGIPIDNVPVKKLCEVLDIGVPMLRQRQITRDFGCGKFSGDAYPVGYVRYGKWTSGIVIENPFFGKSRTLPLGQERSDSFRELSEVKHLICGVHDHFPDNHLPEGFQITDLETVFLGNRRIFQIGCRWDRCPQCKEPIPG